LDYISASSSAEIKERTMTDSQTKGQKMLVWVVVLLVLALLVAVMINPTLRPHHENYPAATGPVIFASGSWSWTHPASEG
jgi:p-aminobenzoyl-glutamate transporter AbgT